MKRSRFQPPPNPRKTRVISFRLTESEFLQFAHRAAASGQAINRVIRDAALSAISSPSKNKAEDPSRDPALLAQLARIGNNLNQMAKLSHIRGRVSPRIENLCDEIRSLIERSFDIRDDFEDEN